MSALRGKADIENTCLYAHIMSMEFEKTLNHLKTSIYNCVVLMLFFASIVILVCVVKKSIWGHDSSYFSLVQNGLEIGIRMTVLLATGYYVLKAIKWVYNYK